MALADGVYGAFLRDMGNNDKAFDLSADTIKLVLLDDAYTPDFDADEDYADVSAFEISGAGYTTGGEALTGNLWGIGGGYATFVADDVSLPGAVLVDVRGLALIDDSVAGDPLIICMDFGALYTSGGGAFEIEWDLDGIWRGGYA